MKSILFVFLILLIAASMVFAVERTPQRPSSRAGEFIYGSNAATAKAVPDSILLMGPRGSGATYFGDLEGPITIENRLPDGFTSIDYTQSTEHHWSLSTINSDSLDYYLPGAHGQNAWCGDYIDSCETGDPAWGYANSWHETLVWNHAVPSPADVTTIDVAGDLWHDTELGWDYIHLSYRTGDVLGYQNTLTWYISGRGALQVAETITYNPGDYVAGNTVEIAFRFQSDSAASDEDCYSPSGGAMNLDNLSVSLTNGAFAYTYANFEDFSTGFGEWTPTIPIGVGDFAHTRTNLDDLDACGYNYSRIACFIDDGVVVPGTGGQQGVNWTYGPGGYIVNTRGGLAGPLAHLQNSILSPIMNWPDQSFDGIVFYADVYVHEDWSNDAPGIVWVWDVRSNNTATGTEIADQPWTNRYFCYGMCGAGNGFWGRLSTDVSDLMVSDRDEFQIRLSAYEYGWVWGWNGDDGYPAPFYDNLKVQLYEFLGPALRAREGDLAQDNFPTRGTIDLSDLGSHSVRFDAAENISPASHARIDPGDSIQIDIESVRSGASLVGLPTLHWTMKQNPVFNPWRTSSFGTATSGMSPGWETPTANRWAFDLPDSNFLFPGDVLHYYVSATDEMGGDQQTTIIPADLAGYGDFAGPLAYNTSFVVHCLPSIRSDGLGDYEQPGILFWNDFGSRGAENEWHGALSNLGYTYLEDYDVYYTNSPSSTLGNGLGGRASHLTLLGDSASDMTGYTDMLYSAGNLNWSTIGNGDFTYGSSDDVTLLKNWLDSGNKDMYLCGDNLAYDLSQSGADAVAFLSDYLGLSLIGWDVRPLIDGQTTPLVLDVAGENTIQSVSSWIAYGGCNDINRFDAVESTGGSVQAAEFADLAGGGGAYSFNALTLNTMGTGSRVVSQPYGFHYLYDDVKADPAPLTARAQILGDILSLFGTTGNIPSDVEDSPGFGKFMTSSHPNPFNPATKITFNMPRRGHLGLKIFNVRGELVRTLIDEVRDAGPGHVMWDGTADSGAPVASGLYFYEARHGDEVQVKKMTLVK